MKKYITFLLLFSSSLLNAQIVQNPVQDLTAKSKTRGYYIRPPYKELAVDINHDGVNDMLLGGDGNPQRLPGEKSAIPYNPNLFDFNVYIGVNSGGYILFDDNSSGMGGIITIDVSKCYIGYIDEIKQYGIVTLEINDEGNHSGHGLPIAASKVYCYTINGYKIQRTDLTTNHDPFQQNAIYDKYLSPSKRTQVQLQPVTP